jgi:hypothetical protein
MKPTIFMPQELIDKFIDVLGLEKDIDALKTLSQTSRRFLDLDRQSFAYTLC